MFALNKNISKGVFLFLLTFLQLFVSSKCEQVVLYATFDSETKNVTLYEATDIDFVPNSNVYTALFNNDINKTGLGYATFDSETKNVTLYEATDIDFVPNSNIFTALFNNDIDKTGLGYATFDSETKNVTLYEATDIDFVPNSNIFTALFNNDINKTGLGYATFDSETKNVTLYEATDIDFVPNSNIFTALFNNDIDKTGLGYATFDSETKNVTLYEATDIDFVPNSNIFTALFNNDIDKTGLGYATFDSETKNVTLYEATDIDFVPNSNIFTALFNNDIDKTGWAYLEVLTNPNSADEDQAYMAGLLEGKVTKDLIWQHWLNTKEDFCPDWNDPLCKKIDNYINLNLKWVNDMIIEKSSSSPYWYQVKLYLKQLDGLAAGYNMANEKTREKKLTFRDLLLMNMDGDLEDLIPAMKGVARSFADSHCSALIKILPNWSDVLTSHVTWTSYQSMLRIQKLYKLFYHTMPNSSNFIKGQTMSFSSYPGVLVSGDDFYVISSKLVTLETTIGNSNPLLWQYVKPIGTVMEFIRVMVANRLAGTGRTWVDIFRMFNSGTYNNQWMIVDYKRFASGSPQGLADDFLWVAEQIPGTVEARDLTQVIRNQGYWPSYNLPYYPIIYNQSGVLDLVNKYGDWFTYDKHPRAQIFKRDQGNIQDMDGMLAMMTYNDFKHDPLSICNCSPPYSAENAISARNDLNLVDGTYPFASLGHRSHGAIDVKITNQELSKTFKFLSVSGPVHNASAEIMPFKWSETDFGPTTPHHGHPDEWKFSPVTHKWLNV